MKRKLAPSPHRGFFNFNFAPNLKPLKKVFPKKKWGLRGKKKKSQKF